MFQVGVAYARLRSHVSEGAIGIILEKFTSSEIADKKVNVTVVVLVAPAGAVPDVLGIGYACSQGHVSKSAVTIVSVERI